MTAKYQRKPYNVDAYQAEGRGRVITAAGAVWYQKGDWIVRDPASGYAVVSDEVFRAAFEPAPEREQLSVA